MVQNEFMHLTTGRRWSTTLCILMVALGSSTVQADFTVFTNNLAWSNAAIPDGFENFSGFTVDTQFRTQSVALNNMTVTGSTGRNGDDSNLIDVPPLTPAGVGYGINGPALIADLEDGQTLNFQFTTPVTAWGANFRGISSANNRITRIDVFNTNNILQGSITPSIASGINTRFFGFTSTEQIGRLQMIATIVDLSVTNNDLFGVDEVRFTTAVPEPSCLSGLAMCAVGLAIWKRRRKPRSKCGVAHT